MCPDPAPARRAFVVRRVLGPACGGGSRTPPRTAACSDRYRRTDCHDPGSSYRPASCLWTGTSAAADWCSAAVVPVVVAAAGQADSAAQVGLAAAGRQAAAGPAGPAPAVAVAGLGPAVPAVVVELARAAEPRAAAAPTGPAEAPTPEPGRHNSAAGHRWPGLAGPLVCPVAVRVPEPAAGRRNWAAGHHWPVVRAALAEDTAGSRLGCQDSAGWGCRWICHWPDRGPGRSRRCNPLGDWAYRAAASETQGRTNPTRCYRRRSPVGNQRGRGARRRARCKSPGPPDRTRWPRTTAAQRRRHRRASGPSGWCPRPGCAGGAPRPTTRTGRPTSRCSPVVRRSGWPRWWPRRPAGHCRIAIR
ncbi:hypothetical protein SAMN04488580_109175 [Mycobacterium sp. 283mftsu]|nr:hypothetical protein SAMN04488580_109175 [Mycobacterium sp. 283mftsu]